MSYCTIQIQLHRLLGVYYDTCMYNGREEEVICIPLRPNGIVKKPENKAFLRFFATEKKQVVRNQTHYLSLQYPKNDLSAMNEAIENGFTNNIRFCGSVYGGFDHWSDNRRGRDSELNLQKAIENKR